jgi:hypothetical protein
MAIPKCWFGYRPDGNIATYQNMTLKTQKL